MNPAQDGSQRITSEIRAEIARQRRRQAELGEILDLSQGSVSARLSGRVPLTVDELLAIAEWLEVDPSDWIRSARGQTSAVPA